MSIEKRNEANANAIAARAAVAMLHGAVPEYLCLNDPEVVADWAAQVKLPGGDVSVGCRLDSVIAGMLSLAGCLDSLPVEEWSVWEKSAMEYFNAEEIATGACDGDRERAKHLVMIRSGAVFVRFLRPDVLALIIDLAGLLLKNSAVSALEMGRLYLKHKPMIAKEKLS